MATVYLGEDLKHARRVAIKVLRPEFAAAVLLERFQREIRIAAQLQHPNIVPLFDSGEADGALFYVMPYVEGESLRSRLARDGPLPLDEAIAIARDIADALSHAHARDVVHRDIKPENVLLSGGRAVVADFGIARAFASASGDALTTAGITVGTPGYMSPEQAAGDRVDARTDIYALGCVAYEMLSGQPPFSGSSAQVVMARHAMDPVPSLRAARHSIAAGTENAILRALAKNPVDRFATAAEFADALTKPQPAAEPTVKSVLVLPFRNQSSEPQSEFFGDGLTDAVIGDLSKIRTLRVISRTSAMRLRDTTKGLAEIADELGVRFVVEGTVRWAKAGVRVSAQVTDVRLDACIWAEKYSGAPDEIFDIEDRVSRSIVDALKVQLSPEEHTRVSKRPIENVFAYESYLRARQDLWRFSQPSLDRASHLIEEALRTMGDNALLYATLAHINVAYVQAGVSTSASYLLRGAKYAAKAVEMDPESSYGLWLQGIIRFLQGDLTLAASDLQASLSIEPNNPDALLNLGYLYALAGRTDLAAPICAKALEVDPLTPITQGMPGLVAVFEGRYADAIEPYRRLLQLEPEAPFAQLFYAWALTYNERFDEAIGVLDRMSGSAAQDPFVAIGTMWKYLLQGQRKRALEAVTPTLVGAAQGTEMFSRFLGEGYAMLNDGEKAVEWLANANRFGLTSYPFLAKHDRLLENIRGQPRFEQFLARVKLQWELLPL
jgi:TolB-like protein/tetratricopeptide (TPR) repeat protein